MKRIAVVRGKFLNRYEMQFFEPLISRFDLTAFGSLTPYHDRFAFPVVKLPSPMDVPEFPYKMPILNRMFIDAHYLLGLETRLSGFDLVHTAETYFRYTQQCLDAKKHGYVKKVIATVLETIPFNNEGIRGRRAYKARARVELDHIIALTEKAKTALVLEGADARKITVIGHFVDTRRFFPTPHAKRSGLTVLFCGRLEEEKGVPDILDAISVLSRDPAVRKQDVTWLFVGDGSQRRAVAAAMRRNGKNWHLELESATYDHMPDVYRRADILVAPSKARTVMRGGAMVTTWEEQYCTVLLEAQASGLPIVTTASGGIPENVGEAAILVSPGDVSALTREIREYILNPVRRRMYAAKARARAVRVHDIRIGSSKLAALYDAVLRR